MHEHCSLLHNVCVQYLGLTWLERFQTIDPNCLTLFRPGTAGAAGWHVPGFLNHFHAARVCLCVCPPRL